MLPLQFPTVLDGETLDGWNYRTYAQDETWLYAYDLRRYHTGYECQVLIAATTEQTLRRVAKEDLDRLLAITDEAMRTLRVPEQAWQDVPTTLGWAILRRKTFLANTDLGDLARSIIDGLPRLDRAIINVYYGPTGNERTRVM